MNDESWLALWLVVGVVVTAIISGCVTTWQAARRQPIDAACRAAFDGHTAELTYHDYWERPIRLTYEENDAGRFATATSAGKDGQFDTADDWTAKQSDFNKSRIIGHWSAGKAVEFSRGVVSGLKEAL